jgi:hypothetical protein
MYGLLAKFGCGFCRGETCGEVAESVAFSRNPIADRPRMRSDSLRSEIRLTRMRNFSLGNDIDSTGIINLGITVIYWLMGFFNFSKKRGRKLRAQVSCGKVEAGGRPASEVL